ncbi:MULTISPECIES: MATE family efflux transporter [Myroides]|uniref:Multidrug-efflux transporter n=1 Tax=Myroides albus TaxID=2562892 RepID=A0A6I3LPK3_9FLAO|nr:MULTISPECIES: MATE family efflux transporter [Myroides]MTG99356.1 MATE family efflux transporter [Myroides albus]MVX34344.1 MATE family efflux transporter [Myroides sp. LoEW2-1]UVD80536.1 MATE family efflux transporter [Myroides albus]
MDKQKQTILNERLPKVMWQMSWPAIAAMVLFGLNNFLDGVFVGHLINNDALAAVGIAFPLAQITQAIGSLIGTGAGAAISIWIGSGNDSKLRNCLGTVNFLSVILSILFLLPAFIFAEELIALMGGRGQIALLAIEYFKVTLLGTFLWVHGLALNMMIRAEGKMKTAAVMIAIGLVIDVLVKPLFISIFDWGIAGAAWATNLSMLVYTLLGIGYYQLNKSSFQTVVWSFKVDYAIFKEIISLGLPALIMMVMVVVQNIVVFNSLGRYGNASDITFFTAVNRFYLLLNTPMFGLMRALQPVAGMNYGVGNILRTTKSYTLFTWAGLFVLLPFWIIVMCFPQLVLSLMIPNYLFSSQQLVDFRIYMSVLLGLPAIFMAMVWFPSVENGKTASIIAILRQLILYVPVILILPSLFGIRSIYWASAFVDWMIFAVVIVVVRKSFVKLIYRTRLSKESRT